MLGGRLLVIALIVPVQQRSTISSSSRTGKQFAESSKDPFVIGISSELNKFKTQYVIEGNDGTDFHRGSVEAAPDALPKAVFSKAKFSDDADFSQSLTRERSGGEDPLPQFYRGNIETGADTNYDDSPLIIAYNKDADGNGDWKYYGAALSFNEKLQLNPLDKFDDQESVEDLLDRPKPTGEVYHPTRQSVEARPHTGDSRGHGRSLEIEDMEDLRAHFRSEHGQDFRQSRPNGHSLTYDTYQARRQNEYKIVCYYGAWSVYRHTPYNFTVTDIDPFACTHLIYSFAGLDSDSLTIKSLDMEEDIVKGSYKSAINLKKQNPKLKVMLAIGGWNEGGKKYSAMAQTSTSRGKFVESVVDFLSEHNFDGFDLDWEYPGAQDRDGGWNDKENFANLVEELYKAFKPHKWLLSAAVSPAKFRVNDGYNVAKISKYLDFINVMTYDLHGSWDKAADHHAPLNKRDHDDWDPLTTDSGISYWHKKGAPMRKLLLGTPFYGRSFTLTGGSTRPGASSSGEGGTPGKYTEEAGFLSYFEICLLKKEGGWTDATDSDGNPYMYKGNQWIGYDTPASIKRKMDYVKNKKLGGAMIWAIDLDDYLGSCDSKWPLLSTMNHELRPLGTELGVEVDNEIIEIAPVEAEPEEEDDYEEEETFEEENDIDESIEILVPDFDCPDAGFYPSPTNCGQYYQCTADKTPFVFTCADGLYYDPNIAACNWPQLVQCDVAQNRRSSPLTRANTEVKKVICYFSNWAGLRSGDGKFLPENIDASLCSHVVYAFAKLDAESLTMIPSGPRSDLDQKFYQRVKDVVKRTNPDAQVLLSLGGWADSAGDKYSRLVNNQESKKNFVSEAVRFLNLHKFDGLVLEWHFPVCWQSDCSKGPPSDKQGFADLVQLLRDGFEPENLILGATLSGYNSVIDAAYDVRSLSDNLDFMNIMTYDFRGFWDGETGHHTPLYQDSADSNTNFNSDSVMKYYVSKGAEKSKLIMGIPFYGQSFSLQSSSTQYGSQASGPGKAGKWTKQAGMLAFYEICTKVKQGWSKNDGNNNYGPFAFSSRDKQWVGYDDTKSVTRKAEYIQSSGFGGAAVWTLDLDDFNNICCQGQYPLLNTISEKLRGVGGVRKGCGRPSPPVTPTPTRPESTTYDDGSLGGGWKDPLDSVNTSPSSSFTTSTTASITTSRRTQTTTRRTTTTTSSTTSSESNEKQCVEGSYYEYPKDCHKYYFCGNGKLILQACGGGLYWSSDAQMCDWNDNVDCNKINIDDDNNHVDVPDIAPVVVGDYDYNNNYNDYDNYNNGDGDNDNDGGGDCTEGEYSSASSCSTFYQCVNGEKLLKNCYEGLHWSEESQTCDWPEAAGCSIARARGVTRATCNEGELDSDPSDCTKYLFCVHGQMEQYSCQVGTAWDNALKVCNFPDQVQCFASGSESGQDPISNKPQPVKPPLESGVVLVIGDRDLDDYSDYNSNNNNDGEDDNDRTEQDNEISESPVTTTSDLSGDYKIVCYFTNWAWYRPGVGKYKAEDVDPSLCTHIVYGFAVLDYSTLKIKPHDTWADIDNKYYQKLTAYKKRGVKVTLAIGGWNDSQGDKYSRLVNNPDARKKFIDHALRFIEKYNFDGLDLDWEYPSCWQTECKEERYKDKQAFATFVSELKSAFKPRNLLLSAAVSPSKKIIDVGYDVPSLAQDLDWIAVMTYDYHGHWDKKTGHVAPFYEHPDDDFYYFNTNYTINYWIEKGAPRSKLVMGMPLYGQSFTLDSTKQRGLNAPARQKGTAGEFTRAPGFLAYYEICHKINQQKWKVIQNSEGLMGPYAYRDNQWVGYDDVDSIRRKSQYIRDMNLGGGMIWALDLDDFNNRCGQGRHPLMNTIKSVLGPAKENFDNDEEVTIEVDGGSSTDEKIEMIEEAIEENQDSNVIIEESDKDESNFKDIDDEEENENEEDYKVVCYFTNWAWYRPETGKYQPEDIEADLCTHIVYGFAVLDPETLTVKAHDTWADFDNDFYKQVTSLKSKGKKVLLAIGGWNDSKGDKYSRMVNNKSSRKTFISHVVNFLTENDFNGLDLDWEYPKCWQVDCSLGPKQDKQGLADLVRELHFAFKPLGLILSAAVSPSNKVIDEAYDIAALDKYVDYVSVMTYDYHGQWDKMTGHVAPMYQHSQDDNKYFNTNFTVHYWLNGGLRSSKLVLGMPMYGQSFTLDSAADNGLNAPSYGGGIAGEFTRSKGFLAYYEICDLVTNKGWKVVHDPSGSMGPYAYKDDQWVSFDDVKMIRHKSQYVKNMKLGGAMIWALDLDDFRNTCGCEEYPLLKTINRELRGLEDGGQDCSFPGNYRLRSLELSPSPNTVCSKGNLAGVEGDCEKYRVCQNGNYQEFTCLAGLHWHRDRCDWPQIARCNQGKRTEESIEDNHVVSNHEIADVVEPVKIADDIIVPDTGKKVVCYFTNWALYRQGPGKFLPDDIDYTLCTHINYGFAVLDPDSLLMIPHDEYADIQKNFYKDIVSLKEKGVKVLIALGGWNDSEGDKYSRMVSSKESRDKFVMEAVKFIEEWGFDGLDLDWEYPKCWQVDCSLGPEEDKEGFSSLVKELSDVMKPKGLILSAAVSPSKSVIDVAYDVPVLNTYLDFINVMTYDFHGYWDRRTGHVSPLFNTDGNDQFTTNFSMNYWAQLGAEKQKLVMGLPMYGQAFSLANPGENGLNSAVIGRGEPGEFTRAGGFLAYYEICRKIQTEGWNVVKDPRGNTGPYVFKDDQWASYDDVDMVRKKSKYINQNDFGGAMIWALDLDDYSKMCECEHYPLLKTINRVLRQYPVPEPDCVTNNDDDDSLARLSISVPDIDI